MLVTCLKRVGFCFFFRKGNVTSRRELATLISWSLPRQRDVTPYRSPGCADVFRYARADVTDFSYMTLMDTSVVKHSMLKSLVASLPSAVCFTLHLNHNSLLRAALVTFMSANYSESKNTVCRDTNTLSLRVSCLAVVATHAIVLSIASMC